MRGKVIKTADAESIDTRIFPDVRPISAVLSKFKIVDVRRFAAFEDEDQFVLRAIKCALACVRLDPHDDIFQFGVIPVRLRPATRGSGANP